MVKEKRKNHIPFRLNVLFFAVFLLFSLLILRLGFIQIVEGDEYETRLSQEEEQTANVNAPRGLMYDRHGNIVVDNELQLALTYMNRPGNEEERIETAMKLSSFLDLDEEDVESITERELQDYWIQTRKEEAAELVGQDEQAELEDDEIYQLQLERITEEDILSEMDQDELETVVIWREMVRGYNYSPNRIAQNIDSETAHRLSEVLHELPGTDIMSDSVRKYPYGESFPTFFGGTGQIPSEEVEQYLGQGYERTDIIGTTFLEQEYESVLRGEKAVMTTNSSGTSTTSPGRRGNDLMLTIDMALQQEVESIIQQVVERTAGGVFLSEREAYVVMMEPETGDILAMAGYNDHLGTVMNSFEIGSTVKPATVLAGYHTGVINHGSVLYDRPLDNIPGTPTLGSWRPMGYINDIDAIRMSSNIYMAEIAMDLAGYNYGSGGGWPTLTNAYHTLREHYAQFGLGVPTGIDLPSESTGLEGPISGGQLLYMSFGQYDTYTPLQLTQFTATLANDGYRMKPRLVKGILESAVDGEGEPSVVRQFPPEVLNRVDNPSADFERMQEGMRQVMQTPGSGGTGGTGYSDFNDAPYSPAGKTGTAQITANGRQGNNQAIIGYAPHDDPEVAIGVIVPNLAVANDGGQSGLANDILRGVLDAYFDMQEEPAEPEEADSDDEIYRDPEESIEEENI